MTKIDFKRPGIIFSVVCATLLLMLICSILVLDLTPPVSRDALVHHLALPKLYLEQGIMTELPCVLHAYYPMNLDLIYMGALYLGAVSAVKFIHAAFGLMTAILIFRHLSVRLNSAWALLGALLFLSIPVIIRLATTVYVDLGLVFFSFGALTALFTWAQQGFKIKYLLLAGISCGLSMGTKYNGLVTAFLLSFIIPALGLSQKRSVCETVCAALLFILVAGAVFSPWMIRNFYWTGNPVYPLFEAQFPSKTPQPCKIAPVSSPDSPGYNVFHRREAFYDETPWDVFQLPIRIFFQGRDNSFQYFDGRLTPFLLIFPLFAFFGKKNRDFSLEKTLLLGFSILFFAVVLFFRVLRVRYFAPILPCLTVLSVYGIEIFIKTALSSPKRLVKFFCLALVSLLAVQTVYETGIYIVQQFQRYTPLAFLTGQISREDYITAFRPEYPVFTYINHHLPESSEILFFYVGKRGYYCDRSYIPDHGRNLSVIYDLIREGQTSPAHISSWFKQRGITHFLMERSLVKKRIRKDLSAQENQHFKRFIRFGTKRLFYHKAFALYELR